MSKLFELVSETVEVGVGLTGWNFPSTHKTIEREFKRKDKDGKEYTEKKSFFVVDVEYVDPLDIDAFTDEEFITEAMSAMDTTDEKDFINACKAGIRLAIGDAAKAPFKEKGQGKSLAAATTWAAMNDDQSYLDKWRDLVKANKKDEATKYLIEAYLANK